MYLLHILSYLFAFELFLEWKKSTLQLLKSFHYGTLPSPRNVVHEIFFNFFAVALLFPGFRCSEFSILKFYVLRWWQFLKQCFLERIFHLSWTEYVLHLYLIFQKILNFGGNHQLKLFHWYWNPVDRWLGPRSVKSTMVLQIVVQFFPLFLDNKKLKKKKN